MDSLVGPLWDHDISGLQVEGVAMESRCLAVTWTLPRHGGLPGRALLGMFSAFSKGTCRGGSGVFCGRVKQEAVQESKRGPRAEASPGLALEQRGLCKTTLFLSCILPEKRHGRASYDLPEAIWSSGRNAS
jgi:hypothetical protein